METADLCDSYGEQQRVKAQIIEQTMTSEMSAMVTEEPSKQIRLLVATVEALSAVIVMTVGFVTPGWMYSWINSDAYLSIGLFYTLKICEENCSITTVDHYKLGGISKSLLVRCETFYYFCCFCFVNNTTCIFIQLFKRSHFNTMVNI